MGTGYKGNKTAVMAMLERNGNVISKVIPDRRRTTLQGAITANVKPHSFLHTDEFVSYDGIELTGKFYEHHTVNHSRGEYVRGRITTNGVEGFWSQLKRGINGTHIHVSAKHLQKYLGEFEFRHNRRRFPHLMLDELMTGFVR